MLSSASGQDLNLLLEPLVTEHVEATSGSSMAVEARTWSGVCDEPTVLLEDELLDLLAAAGM